MNMYATNVYSILKAECGEMDKICKEYIVRLVGVKGLHALIKNKLIETCGVMHGHQMYILCDPW